MVAWNFIVILFLISDEKQQVVDGVDKWSTLHSLYWVKPLWTTSEQVHSLYWAKPSWTTSEQAKDIHGWMGNKRVALHSAMAATSPRMTK